MLVDYEKCLPFCEIWGNKALRGDSPPSVFDIDARLAGESSPHDKAVWVTHLGLAIVAKMLSPSWLKWGREIPPPLEMGYLDRPTL